jgi:epoxyqueuosine reductase QueG
MSNARDDSSELADKNKARVAGCDACLAWSNGIGQAAIT